MDKSKIIKVLVFSVIILAIIVIIFINTFFNNNKEESNKFNVTSNTSNTNSYQNYIAGGNEDYKAGVFTTSLSDSNWVKQNLYIKKDYLGKDVSSNQRQVVKFDRINDNLSIIETTIDDKNSVQCFIVTKNKDEELTVKPLTDDSNQIDHTEYFINKERTFLVQKSQYSNEKRYIVYRLSDSGIEQIYDFYEENYFKDSKVNYNYILNGEAITKGDFNKYEKIYNLVEANRSKFVELNENAILNYFN